MAESAAAGPFTEVVVGTGDVAATVAFLEVFDFIEVEKVDIGDGEARDVFGLDTSPGSAVRMASRQRTGSATVLVVPTPNDAPPTVGWERGPRALDVYTRDLDASIAAARSAGFDVSAVGGLSAGPMTMRQAMVHGPHALSLVLVESTHRRSSVCDLTDGPSHSEPHSVVWVVADQIAEREGWVAAGWAAGNTISFSEPTISDELGLAERPTPITMTMISDADVGPIRLELMTFDGHAGQGADDGADSGAAERAHRGGDDRDRRGPSASGAPVPEPIRTGVHALAADVVSLDAARAAWGTGATFGRTTELTAGSRSCAGTTAGGVRFVLHQRIHA